MDNTQTTLGDAVQGIFDVGDLDRRDVWDLDRGDEQEPSGQADDDGRGGQASGPTTWIRQQWATAPLSRRATRVAVKRGVDLVAAVVLSVVTLPLVAMLAVFSAAVLREWPFFTQVRLGHGGRPIPFIKIRSMPTAKVDEYAIKGQWSPQDLPRSMQFLRNYHLDELPQLWLVISGHLSLVGPRPKMPDEYEPVDADYGAMRVRVPQGCTCLWQIGAHKNLMPSQSPEYDYDYVQHGGLRLDLWILFWTALQIVGLAGPRAIEQVPSVLRSRGWDNVGGSEHVVEMPVPTPSEQPQTQAA